MQSILQLFSKVFWRTSLIFLLFLIVGCSWKIIQIRPGVIVIEEPSKEVSQPSFHRFDFNRFDLPVLEEGYPGKEIELKVPEFKVVISDPKSIADAPLVMKDFTITSITGTGVDWKEEPTSHLFIIITLFIIFIIVAYATYYMIKTWGKK